MHLVNGCVKQGGGSVMQEYWLPCLLTFEILCEIGTIIAVF